MAKNPDYKAAGDPADFAPDFTKNPEPYGNPVIEIIRCFDLLRPGSHIVDVAGGYGKYALPLAQMGYEVTILDCHEASLAEARRRSELLTSGGKINTIFTDVIREDFPVAKAHADAILCVGFAHHLNIDGVKDLFDSMTTTLKAGGLMVLDFSTNKYRRFPDGTPILVDGVPEHNYSKDEGLVLMKRLYSSMGFTDVHLEIVKLYERQIDFWYDADMIVASGIKG